MSIILRDEEKLLNDLELLLMNSVNEMEWDSDLYKLYDRTDAIALKLLKVIKAECELN